MLVWAFLYQNLISFPQACNDDMRNKHKDKNNKQAAQIVVGISMKYILELGKSSSN